jgi:hypothetical protein
VEPAIPSSTPDPHYARVPNVADYLGNTPADIALSLNNEAIYRRVRDAGLRSGPHYYHTSSRPASLTPVFRAVTSCNERPWNFP